MDKAINENIALFMIFSGIASFTFVWAFKKGVFVLEDSFWSGRITSRDLFGAFLFFLGVHIVVAPLTIVYLMKAFSLPADGMAAKGWVVIYSMYLSCFTLFFYSAKLSDPETRHSLTQSGVKSSWQAFRVGALSFLISYPLVIAVGQFIRIFQTVFFDHKEVDQVAVQALKLSFEYPLMSVIMAAGVVCLVPIAEELLFRGFLQGWLRRFLHPKGAILITSLVFSSFHFSLTQGWSNIEFLFSLFILSAILGFLYEKQRSLWAPIGLHMVFNTVNVALLMYTDH